MIKRKKLSGAMRMKKLGYKQSQVWMTTVQHTAIARAAANIGLTVSGFILQAAVRSAGTLQA